MVFSGNIKYLLVIEVVTRSSNCGQAYDVATFSKTTLYIRKYLDIHSNVR